MRPNLACVLLGTALTSSLVVNAAEAGAKSMADNAVHIGQVVVIDQELLSIAADIASQKSAEENAEAPPANRHGPVGDTEENQIPATSNAPEAEIDETKEAGNKDQAEVAPATSEMDEGTGGKEQQDVESVTDEEAKAQNVEGREKAQNTQPVADEHEYTAAEESNDGAAPAEAEEGEPAAGGDDDPAEPEVDDVAVAKQKIDELNQSIQQQEAAKQSSSLSPTVSGASDATIDTVFTFSPITLAPESSKPTRKPTATSEAVFSTQKPSAAPQIVKKVKSSASFSKPASVYLATGTLLFSICIFSQYF